MKTAIKLLEDYFEANMTLSQDYQEKADFYLFKKDKKQFDYYINQSESFLLKANECQKALNEIKDNL